MRCESVCEIEAQTTRRDLRTPGHQNAILEMQGILSLRLPSFYRCALRLLGNSADAEDAVQEGLLAAYRHIDQFRGQAQMTTWLTAIVRNSALMQLRKRPRQIHLSLDEQMGGETRGHASRPRRTVPQYRTQCTPAKIRRAVVACFAQNISVACPNGVLDL